jgi:hypothetical protein
MGGIKMKDDPIIDRIREVRRRITEEHGSDTARLIKHYQELEKNTTRKFFKKEIRNDKVA